MQNKFKGLICLVTFTYYHPHDEKKLLFILTLWKETNFSNGALEDASRCFHCHYSDISVRTRMNTENDSCWPLEWGREVVL
jgi:hypothetical protein